MRVLFQTMLFVALAVGDDPKHSGAVAKAKSSDPGTISPQETAKFEKNLECLALNIYHEARSEPEKGQLAVAAVTLNRVQSDAFPDSVCRVVKQGGQRRNRCQFSWWCDGKKDKPTDTDAWEKALQIGRRTLEGDATDPTNGALYYHATYVKPKWSRTFKRTARVGSHLFYRPKQAQPMRVAALQ
ncbi:MAG: cell wall hydrolase [Pseudomonadota bacterium]|nr:cell wall hydrolase [Pseudomonadota bacterium]